MNNKKVKSIFEILIADLFWGFGFVATAWTLKSFSVYQSLYLRFLLITLVSMLFVFLRFFKKDLIYYFKISFLPALFLTGEIFFQIFGLKFTTPSKAGFITTLFIVMVPILELIFFKRSISKKHWFWVVTSLYGTYLIVGGKLDQINRGDSLILISALFASFHILIIGNISRTDISLFKLNLFQSYWGCILTMPLILLDPIKNFSSITSQAMTGLMSLTFGTTLLAFYFQMRAQKNITASVASLLFLLEAPLAAIFSFYFMNESLSLFQIGGCCLVLFSASGVIITNYSQKNDLKF